MVNNRLYSLDVAKDARHLASVLSQERQASLACRTRTGSAQMFAYHRSGASTSKANALELILNDSETPRHRPAA